MAGRGRGGGRGQMSFNIQVVGIGRGETLPPPTLQPSPLFPALDFKPVPLQTGEEVEYMLALKQELRGALKGLPYYIKPAVSKRDVERYSDKYQTSGPVDNAIDWHPDWKLLPRELKIKVRKLLKEEKSAAVLPKHKQRIPLDKEEIIKKLENLEKKEEEVSSEEEEEKKEEEEDQEEEEDYDEEEHEEETDYIMSYFDNGEEFGGDSDENMDEATY